MLKKFGANQSQNLHYSIDLIIFLFSALSAHEVAKHTKIGWFDEDSQSYRPATEIVSNLDISKISIIRDDSLTGENDQKCYQLELSISFNSEINITDIQKGISVYFGDSTEALKAVDNTLIIDVGDYGEFAVSCRTAEAAAV